VGDVDVYAAIARPDAVRVLIVEENCRSDEAAMRDVAEFFGFDLGVMKFPSAASKTRGRAALVLPVPDNEPACGAVLASCSNNEISQDVSPDCACGVFTFALTTILDGAFTGSYASLMQKALAIVSKLTHNDQTPEAIQLGGNKKSLLTATAFQI
jgi:hypothetical protein